MILNEKTVVITLPKIRYNPDDTEKFKLYCYHQMIKFSDWDISNTDQIRKKDTAINRRTNFLQTARPDIMEMISFNNEISIQLKKARKEMEVEPEITLTRDQWMILSEIGPSTVEEEEDDEYVMIDREQDFL
ncbi:hypothetical protein BpHYR1_047814 [Brachionus plicatilis]|uniref:Uncharacterized protein n=1 Tax=Brachionus plicatilis TaxID=10195 RepID=A0A3M7QZ96_BRAPC|nr:hypothetical protein BpHYR1_047814 [Brachionus plicatilis]